MRKFLVDSGVVVAGLLSLAYVLNFTFGFAEPLPDNLPIVGNLDEATATALFLTCLSYFGITGGRFVNMLRVLAGKPPLTLPEPKALPEGAGEQTDSGGPKNEAPSA